MCGIAGLVGESSRPEVSFELITRAFAKAEVRGTDAAGFWGCNKTSAVIYHKEPGRSSELVKREAWRQVEHFNPDLLLVHARQATPGVGEPHVNRNNHPFCSTSRTLGLIHNGRVPEFEVLRKKYQVQSDCDSEVLLRIIEAGPDRLAGIADIFSFVNQGHLAVAVGEVTPEGRYLWLFRNRHRSLWVVDLREFLGQVFFCSTPEIWQEVVGDADRSLIGRQRLIELPTEEIWCFQTTAQNRQVQGVKRFAVERSKEQRQWSDSGTPLPVPQQPLTVKLITYLNDKEEVAGTHCNKAKSGGYALTHHDIARYCQDICYTANRLSTSAYNLIQEQSLDKQNYQALLDSLGRMKQELEGVLVEYGE